MGMIPKSTKAEPKIGRFSVVRGFILVISMIVSFKISEKITDRMVLRLIISVLCIIATFILTGQSPSNPRRKFLFGLKSFILYFIEPKKFYGKETEQYIAYKQREDDRNAEKADKKQQKQERKENRKAEKSRKKEARKSRKKKN